jgi:hypothetical protein
MTGIQATSIANSVRHERTSPVSVYGSGPQSTWLLVAFGVFWMLAPVALALYLRLSGAADWFLALCPEVFFVPLGLFAIW